MKTMKKGPNTVKALSLALLIIMGFNGCKEKDNYNYNNIYPVIKQVTGAAAPMQGRHYEFTATTRGGSTYSWESALNAEVVPIASATGNWKTFIYFPDVITTADDPEVIIVTETTMGGVESDPDSFAITSVIPFAALPISGPTPVNGGFSSLYSVSPSAADKIFSTYTWEATAGEITPSATEPWKISIAFSNEDVGDVIISLIETTTKGMKDTSYFDVSVLEYCALANNDALVGIWSGDDGFGTDVYPSAVTTIDATSSGVVIHGLCSGWIFDSWGETVTAEGDVVMKINEDGTVSIANQYLFTTDYNGSPYEYWVTGEGRWNNCGTYPTLNVEYVVENKTDGYFLPSEYYAFDTFTATLVMDGGTLKSATQKAITKSSLRDLSFKKRK
jgi:hypothetical protein